MKLQTLINGQIFTLSIYLMIMIHPSQRKSNQSTSLTVLLLNCQSVSHSRWHNWCARCVHHVPVISWRLSNRWGGGLIGARPPFPGCTGWRHAHIPTSHSTLINMDFCPAMHERFQFLVPIAFVRGLGWIESCIGGMSTEAVHSTVLLSDQPQWGCWVGGWRGGHGIPT